MADTMLCPHQSATTADSALRSQRVWATLLLQLQAVPHPLVGKAHIPTTADSLVAHLVAHRLADLSIPPTSLLATCHDLLQGAPSILTSAALDLHAYCSRSAEETDYAAIFLYNKGFLAVQAYRLAHALWGNGQRMGALYLQSRISEVTGIDIHPAATLGHGLVLGHGGGIVIGETALVENNVAIMCDVTLGGTGKQAGKRHPTVGQGTLVGPGTQILGPIDIGEGAKIGAGAVVVKPVRAFSAVAGNPARYINSHTTWPVLTMDLSFPSIDYLIYP
ncbi:serine O-acetyltransferase [Acetobacter okinawensis]|uniref:serine O-acetyltransferase EpsC n=1 Tax=Acetobacter okinawensis TaxID=1076594 RepID=UPI001BABEBB5|nr:serine O-acetyltransferase EpsC [Acetobacter okinawensis]MBS0966656.1 serine O-acetyltransferase [Acetobacter okinawensis]